VLLYRAMAPDNASAAVLVIGDEILTGETVDTNSAFLCAALAARGVPVGRIVTVSDDPHVIANELRDLQSRGHRPIFTSGGIGPTPDDVTRVGIALALGVDLTLDQTAVQRYEELRGAPLNEKQLEMCRRPEGAQPLYGQTTGAPGFRVGDIVVLPGVPEILREMWGAIAGQFHGDPLHVETFTTQMRESEFAAKMEEYQLAYPELKFGSYPRQVPGGWEVRIRVRGKNRELVQEAAAKFMGELGGHLAAG